MQTLTITQEHYSELQMNIAHLLKQVDDLKKQLANTLEIGSHLASNLQQERDANKKLRENPRFIAVVTIDNWHLATGSHFPDFKFVTRGNTSQEAYAKALEKLSENYRLTDVKDKASLGDNFLYANRREVNIIITLAY